VKDIGFIGKAKEDRIRAHGERKEEGSAVPKGNRKKLERKREGQESQRGQLVGGGNELEKAGQANLRYHEEVHGKEKKSGFAE